MPAFFLIACSTKSLGIFLGITHSGFYLVKLKITSRAASATLVVKKIISLFVGSVVTFRKIFRKLPVKVIMLAREPFITAGNRASNSDTSFSVAGFSVDFITTYNTIA